MEKKIKRWLTAENKPASLFIEAKTTNLSMLCAAAGVLLVLAAFALSNSDCDTESRILQGVLMSISVFAFAPLFQDIHEAK